MAIEFISNFNNYGVISIPDTSWLNTDKWWTSVPGGLSANLDIITKSYELQVNESFDIFSSNDGYIRLVRVSNTNYSIRVYYHNTYVGSAGGAFDYASNFKLYFGVGIDDSSEKGYISIYIFNTSNSQSRADYIRVDNSLMYLLLKSALGPEYNWQSVPSINGKNGILSLVTLDSESINDGEPVSGAAVSVFDQNPLSGNNVKDIVDGNTPLIPSAVDVTAAFIISNPPVGELASRILAAKKGSIPESIEDADKTVSIPANASNVTMPGLDENSQYYFAIFVADATGDTAVSDPKDIYTSGDEGWVFDYTGQIQTFTAPKTGIYSLETWGAQGGDATDGTNTARGGYGAYAYGEVLLQQGETLYINVGGQNGYGGGGNYVPDLNPEDYSELLAWANDDVNGYGFFWKDSSKFTKTYDSGWWTCNSLIYDEWLEHSYFYFQSPNFNQFVDTSSRTYTFAVQSYYICATTNVLRLDIDYDISTGTYIGTIGTIDYMPEIYEEYVTSSHGSYRKTPTIYISAYLNNQGEVTRPYYRSGDEIGSVNLSNLQSTYTYSNANFETVLNHFAKRFNNIYIYVNGALWSQPHS